MRFETLILLPNLEEKFRQFFLYPPKTGISLDEHERQNQNARG